LDDLLEQTNQAGLALLFDLRHDFPTEWSAFVNGTGDKKFSATIREEFFPYFAQSKKIAITGAELYNGDDVTMHNVIEADTFELGDEHAFTVTAGTDQVPWLAASARVSMIVRYALAT
jgi:hypothetical protein